MGSKSAIVVISDGSPGQAFRSPAEIDYERSSILASRVLGAVPLNAGQLPLGLAVWPKPDVVCAASFPRHDVVCSREFAQYRPTELAELVSELGGDRDVHVVAMRSAEDWSAFSVWSGRKLRRAVSLSPSSGVIEEIGDRFSFEEPFWAGRHPVRHAPDYPLPFHPIDFGNEALRSFFGFIIEGVEDEACIDLEEVSIPAFRQVNRGSRGR